MAETGFGATNWVLEANDVVDGGPGLFGIDERDDVWVAGVAVWKSSNSSSSTVPFPLKSPSTFDIGPLPLDGVLGGMAGG